MIVPHHDEALPARCDVWIILLRDEDIFRLHVLLACPLSWVSILNWPERIKTQPHDDRDNFFCTLTQKAPAV